MIFRSSQPMSEFFYSFTFLHPITESFSLHSSLTKQDGRHKLQYFGHWGQMCKVTWKRSGSSLQEMVNMTSVCLLCVWGRNWTLWCDGALNKKLEGQSGEMGCWDDFRGGGWKEKGIGGSVRDGEASSRLQLTADTVQVVHGSVKGEPHSFSDAGGMSLL